MTSYSSPSDLRRLVAPFAAYGAILLFTLPTAFGGDTQAILALVLGVAYLALCGFWLIDLPWRGRDIAVLTLAPVVFAAAGLLLRDRAVASPASVAATVIMLQVLVGILLRIGKALLKAPVSAVIGLFVVACYLLAATAAPIISPFGESEVVGGQYEPWSAQFLLGTDNVGRDMLSRLIFGARNTVGIAFAITCLAFLIGGLAGLFSASSRGWIDTALGRCVDLLMAIPQLIFALLILTVAGTSVLSLIITISVLDATRIYRLVRAAAMNIMALDYVEAAKLRGEGFWWIVGREVLPNIVAPLAVEFGIRFCFVFLFISSLSFLGVGIQPPTADWGSMVRDNAALISYGDITPLLPAAAIGILAISVNFLVDWFLHKTSGLKQ